VITAADTNVLSDVFRKDLAHYEASSSAVRKCLQQGALIACDAVWAETIAAFASWEEATNALNQLPVKFMTTSEAACANAGQAWRKYRRAGGPRTRIISDFLVGAHALETADRLLTRDRGFYRTYFKDLKLFDPSGPNSHN